MESLDKKYLISEVIEEGTFTEEMIDYPTVKDGVEGLAFVEACLKSSQNGNVWVEL